MKINHSYYNKCLAKIKYVHKENDSIKSISAVVSGTNLPQNQLKTQYIIEF